MSTIDGTGLNDSVVKCVSGEGPDTVLDGFTITGGTGSACFSASCGGGMLNDNSNPTVTNCTFSGNTARNFGGGMSNDSSFPTVTNCTFSDNTARSGSGMYNSSSSPTVSNCTFNRNGVSRGSGMYSSNEIFGQGNPVVLNCILWDNSPNQIVDALGAKTTVSYSDVRGGFPGTGNINADPLFVDADGLDGIPGTGNDDLGLQPGSPCIDTADNTAVLSDTADLDGDGDTTERTPLDLDGNPRFVDDPATADSGNGTPPIVDMGAYEFHGCGDGVLDLGEECDDGLDNSDTEPDACRTNCMAASCGDGVVDTGETCDDGPDNSDTEPDACRTDCTAASCGDEVIDTGEECDNGLDNSDTEPDACRTDCTAPSCGDGVIDTGEECDDGNLDDGDFCTGQCLIEGACCDRSPGVGGSCSVTLQNDCVGIQLAWRRGASCAEAFCEEATGTCCNSDAGPLVTQGICTGNVLQRDCDCETCKWTKIAIKLEFIGIA